jgi:putative SOS response-associated peptidase YedK
MCGRYELKASARELISHFRVLSIVKRDLPEQPEQSPGQSILAFATVAMVYIVGNLKTGLTTKQANLVNMGVADDFSRSVLSAKYF